MLAACSADLLLTGRSVCIYCSSSPLPASNICNSILGLEVLAFRILCGFHSPSAHPELCCSLCRVNELFANLEGFGKPAAASKAPTPAAAAPAPPVHIFGNLEGWVPPQTSKYASELCVLRLVLRGLLASSGSAHLQQPRGLSATADFQVLRGWASVAQACIVTLAVSLHLDCSLQSCIAPIAHAMHVRLLRLPPASCNDYTCALLPSSWSPAAAAVHLVLCSASPATLQAAAGANSHSPTASA